MQNPSETLPPQIDIRCRTEHSGSQKAHPSRIRICRMCAVETVLRKTSPYAADYPQLVEQYMDAVNAYRQAVADTENAIKPHTGTAA